MESTLNFFSEEIDFSLDDELVTSNWILNSITEEEKVAGDINYIFCSDDYLYKMNVEHLDHDTLTDIITFNYCEGNVINSDIFISIDRVKENAILFNSSFSNELNRVIIHGVLHLVGYDDKNEVDKITMRAKEDFYLSLL